jgi:hypothetical protein
VSRSAPSMLPEQIGQGFQEQRLLIGPVTGGKTV